MISNLNVTGGCSDPCNCLEAEGHSNEESNIVNASNDEACVQEPKPNKPLLTKSKNGIERKLSDLSASDSNTPSKRRRSSRSSPDRKSPNTRVTKGSSEKSSTKRQGSRSMVNNQNLRMFVTSKLEQYKSRENKYNGLIRILADAGFLQFCYMLLKGKPGNMSVGATKETLDGISYE